MTRNSFSLDEFNRNILRSRRDNESQLSLSTGLSMMSLDEFEGILEVLEKDSQYYKDFCGRRIEIREEARF